MIATILLEICLGGILPGQVETVYIVPLSHTDIGFTAPPRQVAEAYRTAAEEALAAAGRDPDYVWNFETFWQFEQWLVRQEKPAAMIDLIRQGRFGLSAAYVIPHTSLMSDWLLNWLFRLPAEWAREHGLSLDWAMLNDVPGHPPDLPRYLVAHGIRYLALGVNQSLSKPLPAEVCNSPFWWEAPDGSRVLVWIDQDSYTAAFEQYGIDPGTARFFNPTRYPATQPVEVMAEGITRMMERYAAGRYPFDAVLAMHGFDNWGSSAAQRLPEAVRLWNRSGRRPRLVLSTPRAFFEHIERAYGPDLPVRRGGFGGQWEPVRAGIPSAIERARTREARLREEQQPAVREIGRLLVFWEHSFGMGPPWPGLMTREQAVEHNRQQWELIADWPLPDRSDRPRRPRVDVPQPAEHHSLRSNQLYLVGLQGGEVEYHKLPEEAHPLRIAERMPNGDLRLRHQIRRDRLPDPARVVWAWKLTEEQTTCPVVIQTASGRMSLPGDALAGYMLDHWVAPRGFELAGTAFRPRGPFVFSRPPRPRKWLLAEVLGQSLSATFKEGQKGTLTLAEAYPGEEVLWEFTIDISERP